MDIVEELQKLTKEKFGIEISEEDIEDIIASQSLSIKEGMINMQDVKCNYLGKFKIKARRLAALQKDESKKKLPNRNNTEIKQLDI